MLLQISGPLRRIWLSTFVLSAFTVAWSREASADGKCLMQKVGKPTSMGHQRLEERIALSEAGDQKFPPTHRLSEERIRPAPEDSASSKKETDSEASAMALILFGMVACAAIVGNLLTSSYKGVRQTTAMISSYGIAMFCAVTIVSSIKCISESMLLGPSAAMGEPYQWSIENRPTLPFLAQTFGRWLCLLLAFEFLLIYWRCSPSKCIAVASMGSQVVGFAAIEAFGCLQHVPPFNRNPGWSMIGIAWSALLIRGVGYVTHYMRRGFSVTTPLLAVTSPLELQWDEEKWHELCDEAEDDISGLTLGLLISMTVRFCILETVPHVHGNPTNKSKYEICLLLVVSFLTAMICVAGMAAVSKLRSMQEYDPYIRREVPLQTLWISIGWMLVSWSNWIYFSTIARQESSIGVQMEARMVIALSFTFSFTVAIYFFQFVAVRVGPKMQSMRHFVMFWALLLGISWKKAFEQANHSVASQFQDPVWQLGAEEALRFFLLALIVPGWILYILPWVSQGLEWQLGVDGRYEEVVIRGKI